jgi:hypothetical protein
MHVSYSAFVFQMVCILSQALAWYCYIFQTAWVSSQVKTLMTQKESVSETLAHLNNLARLSAQQDFIAFCCRKSFKTYTR